MSRGVDLTKRLRGYNVKQVEEYLEELEHNHAEKISVLKKQIENSLKEKDRLYDKLVKFQNEKEKQNRSKELLDLALIRAKEAVSFFDNKAKEEADDIIRKTKQQNEDNEYKLNDIDNEIKLTRMRVESLLQDMMKILKDSASGQEHEKEETATGKVVGKIFPASSKSKGTEINGRTYDEKKNGLAGKTKKETDEGAEKTSEALEQRQKMTADGAVPVDNQYSKLVDKISGVLTNDGHRQDRTQPEVISEEGKPEETAEEGFWGECSDVAALSREASDVVKPPVIDIGSYMKKKETDILAAVQTGAAEKEVAATVEELLGEAPTPPAGVTPVDVLPEPVKEKTADLGRTAGSDYSLGRSPAVAAEISSIRYKYIVGKLAGEDLLDSNGKIIIAKNEKITPEIVTIAETEGKLPELIVNMIIPGMEE